MTLLASLRRDAALRTSACLAVAMVLLAACGGDSVRPPTVARVAVSGVSDSLTVGDKRAVLASVSDAQGAAISGRRVTWSTRDAAIATVDSNALVTAVGPGQTSIVAMSDGVRGELAIAVRRRPVSTVAFERAADTVWLGRIRTLTALPRAADGTILSDRSVAWTIDDTTIATIASTANGSVVLRSGRLGNTRLRGRSESATADLPIAVVRVPVSRMTLAAPDTVLIGRTDVIRATLFAPDGTTLTIAELYDRGVAWSSDATAVFTASPFVTNPTAALLSARSGGMATITGEIDGVAARFAVASKRATAASVSFASNAVSMRVGDATIVGASALGADNLSIPNAPFTFAVSTGSDVVRVTTTTVSNAPAVRVEAIGAGQATVTVTLDGKTATLPVTVTPASMSIRIYPSVVTAAPGARGQFTVVATDSAGGALASGPVDYRSSNPSVATVDVTGRMAMLATGTSTISATVSGRVATSLVTVTAASSSTFHIEVRPVGVVPPEVVAAAERAARRWERVITTALPVASIDLNPSDCLFGAPALHATTNGLVVFLNTQTIDGARGTLAYAGPCLVRDAILGGLPVVGMMTVDSADVGLLTGTSAALADDVLAHELGHVLGIGTLWGGGSPAGNLVRNAGGDPRFTGAAAAAATASLGLTANASDGAQIEDTGGPGTAGGHWRERVFLGELMTGWISAAPNPMSVVTVLSLRDLGYAVTETGADIVSPVSIGGGPTFLSSIASSKTPFPSRGSAIASPFRIGEQLLRPKFSVDRTGTRRTLPQATQQPQGRQ